MNSIGNRIKQARLGQGFSQVELAEAAHVSQPTVANWENDSHVPRQNALDRLADILSTSSNWIRVGDDSRVNGAHTSRTYLARQIHHVPISSWPSDQKVKDGMLSLSSARDYVALSLNIPKPFALIANDPNMGAHFPIGVAIIFDDSTQELESGKCYLFELEGKIVLRRWQSEPNRLEALPNQSAVDADFVTETPTPLAKAVMSVRRH
ncbi:MAG: helix-turn-helix transcriptional regulator [Robiginitomaculum sp.]|nr:helix-turn-helix transcriptional regulator [Robiginitomaculum sp.]